MGQLNVCNSTTARGDPSPVSDMNQPVRPIYLFADSQLLFWRNQGVLFLDSLRRYLAHDSLKAAYIGASNGDAPEFYLIFEAAMEGIGIHNCRMIRTSFTAEDEAYLNEADIILLAGGDVAAGWKSFGEMGIKELIIRRYYEGAVLMGTSAGAVQLGLCGLIDTGQPPEELLDTFKLIPFVIDAHDEKRKWARLKRAIRLLDGVAKGIGIPTGGGLIYYQDQSIEAIRHALSEFSIQDGEIRDALLMPDNEGAA
ncbi:MAG: Type 1 glutamine amidotransferase-like domain-containing protein [Acidobacteria bacterium]|nr:Type 1 glutamine amidotransferase-like domain-containing protein [Acidobacteriota bacterium]